MSPIWDTHLVRSAIFHPRVRDTSGVLVFHAFAKKTRETPKHEIALARARLKEMQQ
jgi:phage-related protein